MSKYTPSKIGRNLRRFRLARGVTQKNLAIASETSMVAIAQCETGMVRYPRTGTLEKWAACLGVPAGDFFLAESTAELDTDTNSNTNGDTNDG